MMKRLAAAAALLVILVAPPLLLRLLGFHAWSEVDLLAPADPRLLLGALTVVGWLAWGVWVLSLALEAARLVTAGRLTVRLPLLAAPQALAAALLTSVLVASPAAAHAAPTTSTVALAVPAGGAPATARPGPVAVDPRADDDRVARHVVRSGDDLWSLAERYYDDGRAWRRIVAANPALQADPTAALTPGLELRIIEPVTLVTVRAGDTLSGLALEHLGDADRWPEIHRLNKAAVADPDVIDVGWRLAIPRVVAAATAAGSRTTAEDVHVDDDSASRTDGGRASTAGTGESARTSPDNPADRASASPPAGLPAAMVESPPPPAALAPAQEERPWVAVVGGLTSLTAAAVLGGLEARRRLQERSRPLGRRYAQPAAALSRVETALDRVREPDRDQLVARALRVLAGHWRDRDEPVPELARVLVGDAALEFDLGGTRASRPEGFEQVGDRIVVAWSTLRRLAEPDVPVAWPALVTLGADDQGVLVMVDLLASGVLGVRGEGGTSASDAVSAMLVELTCAPWADDLTLLVASADDLFVRAASEGRARTTDDPEGALAEVEAWTAQRRLRLAEGGRPYAELRADPLVADAWAPKVAVFELALDADQAARLSAAVEAAPCGVAAIVPVDAEAGDPTWQLAPHRLTPHTVPRETRDALADLFAVANDPATRTAPWWTTEEPDDVNIIALRPAPGPAGPHLRLLGPVELDGAAGEPPARAARQCLEYCAWLLLNPRRTAPEMNSALLVADGTRRSNLSRLRTWLGSDAHGAPFLPEAYSGRIELHDAVTSDWEHLRTLVAHGVNRTPPERLRSALELVRGAPLADAAPGQWRWAEEVRADMVATIRDIGVVLARVARDRGDHELARWAANRALLAAPDDELLLAERIRTERACGRGDEVARLVGRMTRHAATLSSDLLPESVDLLQEVLEGRRRARA